MTGIFDLHICLTALAASLLLVPPLRHWATEMGALDLPDERKTHETPTPHIGGVAIFAAFLFSTLIYVDFSREVRGILGGALVIFCTGLVDDLYGLSPNRKFLGQILACAVTIFVGGLYVTRLGDLVGVGEIQLPTTLAIPFTVIGVVGVINALNLSDGLDGLAGGLSAIALGAFLVLAATNGNETAVALCAGLLGALLGFLRYNSFPAKIFMGDTGSMVLGHILGFLAVALTRSPGPAVKPVVVLMILGLPVIDTLWVMGARLLRGKNPFSPDRTHLHHRFLKLGLRHPQTVLLLYAIALFWVTVALFFYTAPDWALFATYTGVCLACQGALAVLLRRYPDGLRLTPARAKRQLAVVAGRAAPGRSSAERRQDVPAPPKRAAEGRQLRNVG